MVGKKGRHSLEKNLHGCLQFLCRAELGGHLFVTTDDGNDLTKSGGGVLRTPP